VFLTFTLCIYLCALGKAAETEVHQGIEDEAGLLWDASGLCSSSHHFVLTCIC